MRTSARASARLCECVCVCCGDGGNGSLNCSTPPPPPSCAEHSAAHACRSDTAEPSPNLPRTAHRGAFNSENGSRLGVFFYCDYYVLLCLCAWCTRLCCFKSRDTRPPHPDRAASEPRHACVRACVCACCHTETKRPPKQSGTHRPRFPRVHAGDDDDARHETIDPIPYICYERSVSYFVCVCACIFLWQVLNPFHSRISCGHCRLSGRPVCCSVWQDAPAYLTVVYV